MRLRDYKHLKFEKSCNYTLPKIVMKFTYILRNLRKEDI